MNQEKKVVAAISMILLLIPLLMLISSNKVVPLGLEWAAANYYGDSASRLGLNYLEYKIELKESSLLDQCGRDHPVTADPKSIFSQRYRTARATYLGSGRSLVKLKPMELIGGFSPSS